MTRRETVNAAREMERMKNRYVTNENGHMIFRGTLEECRAFVKMRRKGWEQLGRRQPGFSIYYDTAREPEEVFAPVEMNENK